MHNRLYYHTRSKKSLRTIVINQKQASAKILKVEYSITIIYNKEIAQKRYQSLIQIKMNHTVFNLILKDP